MNRRGSEEIPSADIRSMGIVIGYLIPKKLLNKRTGYKGRYVLIPKFFSRMMEKGYIASIYKETLDVINKFALF